MAMREEFRTEVSICLPPAYWNLQAHEWMACSFGHVGLGYGYLGSIKMCGVALQGGRQAGAMFTLFIFSGMLVEEALRF